ncbi:DUF4258 domain-containing protein [Henriciella marina]|uniref:DUF4258 domain-containing protein n=1 Tax=Henriciella marina TaxID=453851 RepID=UPI0012E9FD38|nr:DUF4258 domain-containing protein [Henriciella marina]
MADDLKRVTQFLPRVDRIESRIRELAQDSFNVLIKTQHAAERQDERGITDKMIFDVLRKGFIDGDIRSGSEPGEWKCKMTRKVNGSREVGVVSVLIRDQRILVITAEWEDL